MFTYIATHGNNVTLFEWFGVLHGDCFLDKEKKGFYFDGFQLYIFFLKKKVTFFGFRG